MRNKIPARYFPNQKPVAIAISLALDKDENRKRNRPNGPNDNDPLKYLGWFLAAVMLFWLLCQTAFAQSPTLKVEGDNWNKGTKIALSSELTIEAPFNVKRVKVLKKHFNDYKLESYIDVKPPAKTVGLILSVSANKIVSGDEIQLLLIPENESLKINENESSFYITVQ